MMSAGNTRIHRLSFHTLFWFPAFALALLAMTMAWHLPLMLWDHLDLVPLYTAWQGDALDGPTFWQIHGGHFHSAAYIVLLLTTQASNGQPWLDCLISWMLLTVFAMLVLRFLRDHADGPPSQPWLVTIALFCFYPGHLANLQWGWQIAVFLCLAGVSAAISLLTRPTLRWSHNILALLASSIAVLSFATGLAILPTALLLISLRRDLTWSHRLELALPWLCAGTLLAVYTHDIAADAGTLSASPGQLILYAFNLLGSGVARFATGLAPWLVPLSLISLVLALRQTGLTRSALPWLGLFAFACTAAFAIALGRAGPYGADHAFASRYVSFSSLYWLGWLGIMSRAAMAADERWRRRAGAALACVVILALGNAVQMMGKAARLAAESRTMTMQIQQTWPETSEALLGELYFGQPNIARQRLEVLHRLGFPPFGKPHVGPRRVIVDDKRL